MVRQSNEQVITSWSCSYPNVTIIIRLITADHSVKQISRGLELSLPGQAKHRTQILVPLWVVIKQAVMDNFLVDEVCALHIKRQ